MDKQFEDWWDKMSDRTCPVCERAVTDEDIESSGQLDVPVEQETCPFCGHKLLEEKESTKKDNDDNEEEE